MTYQKYDGMLHFATDAWTSPNHRAYSLVIVQFEDQGERVSLILDVVEIAKSHTGVNLAVGFAKITDKFGISDKVLPIILYSVSLGNDRLTFFRSLVLLATMHQTTMR